MAGAFDRMDKETIVTSPSTGLPATGYGALSQPELQKQINYLQSLQSTPGSAASARIGEELSMAKLYLQPEVKTEEPPTGGGGGTGGPVISPTVTSTGNISTTVTPTAPTAAEAAALVAGATTLSPADQARENAISVMQARFKQYGLETLAAKIRQLAIDGATESTITLQLQETPEYQARFKANADRIKKGLQVLSPSEYLTVEDTYRQVLRAYGLKQFDTDEYVSQFISNDVSPTELSNRVQIAVQRVQNADPAVSKTLRDYYGIGQADLVAYTLDPATQYQKIERQVQAAEIGTAARIQGLETGVGVAEQLAAQGVTAAEAQKGYATIADILPSAEKLSAIYGGTMDTYGQSQAEQEVFNSLASAQRARQRLSAREVAQFSGSSGAGRTSLSSGSGQI
jgi:hypothetical protein